MLTETAKMWPESVASRFNFEETELTLRLPGRSRTGAEPVDIARSGKRGFSETVDLSLGSSRIEPRGKDDKSSASKAQVVGWPPVRSYGKMALKSCRYVKVAVDGAPYLRKVDLEVYSSYQQLLHALEEMFTCLTICHGQMESKLIDPVSGTEYTPTYEDRDGDWMLVGDVPWKMFVESCKRVRLMKRSEASGLGSREQDESTS